MIHYCFAGLKGGMSEDDRVRRTTFSMTHLLVGPVATNTSENGSLAELGAKEIDVTSFLASSVEMRAAPSQSIAKSDR